MMAYTLSKQGVRLYQKTHYWIYKIILAVCCISILLLVHISIDLSRKLSVYESKMQSLQSEVISTRLHNEYAKPIECEQRFSKLLGLQELGYNSELSLKNHYSAEIKSSDPNTTSPQEMAFAINRNLQNRLWEKFETNIDSVTGLTAKQFNDAIDRYLERSGNHTNSILHGAGDALVKAEERYHVNAIHILGIIGYESGHATSENAKTLNNIAGIFDGQSSKQKVFVSVDQCIDYLAKLIREEYIDKGRKEISDIAPKYLNGERVKSASSENWAYNVTEIAHNYLNAVSFIGDF